MKLGWCIRLITVPFELYMSLKGRKQASFPVDPEIWWPSWWRCHKVKMEVEGKVKVNRHTFLKSVPVDLSLESSHVVANNWETSSQRGNRFVGAGLGWGPTSFSFSNSVTPFSGLYNIKTELIWLSDETCYQSPWPRTVDPWMTKMLSS